MLPSPGSGRALLSQLHIATPQVKPELRGGQYRHSASAVSNATIEILLANGRLVRASAGIDTVALARIVRALDGGA